MISNVIWKIKNTKLCNEHVRKEEIDFEKICL